MLLGFHYNEVKILMMTHNANQSEIDQIYNNLYQLIDEYKNEKTKVVMLNVDKIIQLKKLELFLFCKIYISTISYDGYLSNCSQSEQFI